MQLIGRSRQGVSLRKGRHNHFGRPRAGAAVLTRFDLPLPAQYQALGCQPRQDCPAEDHSVSLGGALRLNAYMDTHSVVIVDTSGVITSWNDGAVQLFGHTESAAVGQLVDLIVPEHLRDAHWAGFHRAMAVPEIKDMAADLPVLCSDGTVREFAGRLLALSDGLGVAIGAIGIYRAAGSTGVRPFSASSSQP